MTGDNEVTYYDYLRLGPVLSQQRPRSADESGDELMFIVTHQTSELWFKVMLRELAAIRDTLAAGAIEPALLSLRRIAAVQQVLTDQIAVLESMHPGGFLTFRDRLGNASGYESVQYREIEFLAGLKDEGAIEPTAAQQAGASQALYRRLAEPSVWDATASLLVARGLAAGTGDGALREAIKKLTADPAADFLAWELLRALLEFDRDAATWRARHTQMAEQMIGRKPGTGGSSGVEYLASRVEAHYFPLLWDAATML